MAHEFIKHLKEDHEKQRELGKELQQAKDPKKREKLRQQMHEELNPHVEGEEASIFDYMKKTGGQAHEEALKAIQEHHIAKIVMNELMNLSLESEVFEAKAYVLDELNTHHMDEEEETHFPLLEEIADKGQIDELFELYEETEEEVEKKLI